MSEDYFPDEIRTRLSSVARRAQEDAAFHEQLTTDPMAVLTAAGVPAPDVQQLLEAAASEGEVSGYAQCTGPTCLISICPGSCLRVTPFW